MKSYGDIPLTLKNDYAFKKVFGDENNKKILQRLLSVILKINEENIKDIELKNNEIEGTYYGDKKSVLDIRLTYNDNTKVNIEMQNIWGDDYIKRVLFYWSKRYTDDFQKGQAYDELQKTIVISILGEKFPYQDELHSIARLYFEKDKKLASDSMELYFLDLTKVDDKNIDDLNKWMLFIKTEDREVRSMLSMQDDIMKQANDYLEVLWSNERERHEYESRFMYECDIASMKAQVERSLKKGYDSGYGTGYNSGLEKGIQSLIETYRYEFNIPKNIITKKIVDKFNISNDAAVKYVDKFYV